MFGPTDVTIIFGQRGCGKSTLGRRISSCYPRLVVVDRLREWSGTQCDHVTDRFDSFALFLRDAMRIHAKRFRACFQFEVEAERKDEIFSQVMRLCYKYGEITRENSAVLIEEVHHFASAHRVDPWLFESVMTGRHSNQAIICSSQRPASVSKALVSQATHVFCGQLFEKNDIEYLRDFLGDDADRLPKLQKFRFLHYQPGIGISEVGVNR